MCELHDRDEVENAPRTVVTMVDAHDNDGEGQTLCEALYVETLIVEAGATLNTLGCAVYYANLQLDGIVDDYDELETRLAEAAANDEEVITFVVMEDQIRSDETPAPTATPASTQRDRRTLLDYSDSALIWSLLSDQLRNDDVAIMGVVSGARSYCGLNWQQGFAQFIQIAAQNGWDVTAIAEEHGRFMGGARRSLQEAGYQCNANDLQTLEAIYP